jgi:hypothetical protein
MFLDSASMIIELSTIMLCGKVSAKLTSKKVFSHRSPIEKSVVSLKK